MNQADFPAAHWIARPIDGYQATRTYLVRPFGDLAPLPSSYAQGVSIVSALVLQGVTLHCGPPEKAPSPLEAAIHWLIAEQHAGWQVLEPAFFDPDLPPAQESSGPACCGHMPDCSLHCPPHAREAPPGTCGTNDGHHYSHVPRGAILRLFSN